MYMPYSFKYLVRHAQVAEELMGSSENTLPELFKGLVV